MASPVIRPRYTEGQVLAAADLEAQTSYGRLDSAIHERTEHTWGIASGLVLELKNPQVGNNSTPYGTPTISPGVAVDPSGRRIVVAEERSITEREFINAGVWTRGATSATQYPIYLVAIDETVVSGRAAGRCAVDAPTRMAESFQIEIGFPGSERNVISATPPAAPAAAPGTGGKILLGFVRWTENVVPTTGAAAFTSAGPDADMRYVGVRASSVIPHAGTLLLATGDGDPRFVLQLFHEVQGKTGLRFGRQSGTAESSDLLFVDDQGNLKIAGKLTSEIPQVPIAMSGSISHGLRLPLPAGVTEDMVADGRMTLQYLISPRLQKTQKLVDSAQTPTDMLPTVIECAVDPDPQVRRVTCRYRWHEVDPGTVTPKLDGATLNDGGTADYLLIATPKAPS